MGSRRQRRHPCARGRAVPCSLHPSRPLRLREIFAKHKMLQMFQEKALSCTPFRNAPVAHLDRVLVSEAKGGGFESRRAHQSNMKVGTESSAHFYGRYFTSRLADAP